MPAMSALMPVYRAAQIRELERAACAAESANQGSPMERAGRAAAALAGRLLGASPQRPGRKVLVVAGPGNNGGDAFEVATLLKQSYYEVTLVFAGTRNKLPPDAALALKKWETAGGAMHEDIPAGQPWDLVVDGLFGIGLARPLEGRHAALVGAINTLARQRATAGMPVLALDIPSGINGDTGAVMGVAVRASHTLTFIAHKPGLLTLDGPDCCGELHCDTLGMDAPSLLAPQGEMLNASVRDELPARPQNFHKGMAGEVAVIGGATGMVGAALLAARAAMRMGAGKVFVGLLASKSAPAFDTLQLELMFRTPRQAMAEAGVLLLGPGMGQGAPARALLKAALAGSKPLVLDADALNQMSSSSALAALCAKRKAVTLLTPHPAEAGRLLGQRTPDVQADRIAATCALAKRYRSLVVLKGNGSVLAEPGGRWWINPTGNPGMASAGMGDALAGLLAGFVAQRMEPAAALRLAVWLHGAAGDELCATGHGPLGITASDVIEQARLIVNRPFPHQTSPRQ